MLATIIVGMVLIVSAWSIWFFPNPEKNKSDALTFESFKHDIAKAFSIFTPEKPVQKKVDLEDLRSQVFGDSIKR